MKIKWVFAIVTFVIGFMLAIQFQTTQEPVTRDTRDIRELRAELLVEQEKKQQLYSEISNIQSVLDEYKQSVDEQDGNITDVLERQIAELRESAGLSEQIGPGIVIKIDSLYNDYYLGQDRFLPSAELFRYLVNELNIYGATGVAVGNERMITTSAFREVNKMTYLNNRRLPPLPIEVKVLSDSAERLHNQMLVSASMDFLEIEGFTMTIEIVDEIQLPGFDQTPRVRYMKEVKED
ncbi:DUF881 domain-containing protein [Bacillus suaedae]|uniref:DUF881 domain-containing protein n=1 Tax=Halalkalibacter suaedae TaxID=2822140 RepID=A0A941APT3_9BACI|nr:DUF881 domain-containing protein [Bacillus suaedae]MBP3952121.1 DUF881 domain-containing protein [Bacillus suaedae]